jgi:hypothetical protein
MGRGEVGTSFAAARPVVFYDVGWAGPRSDFTSSTLRPLQGVGVGASFLDGMVRFDLSRGLTPNHGFRADMYLEARFGSSGVRRPATCGPPDVVCGGWHSRGHAG